ncbi:hypothetical protein BJ878DRAFT_484282 [Calycina marina]|uniref:Uncharacterized protein n=1 Tax=Calycina marina TaxID=1763456 RepID=A0A9P7YVF6_9HELO|nr:hypothetical protein BJ878DRAFT_484282 [Calycina marina]
MPGPGPGPDQIRTDSDLIDDVPQTPTIPVSAEAFMSLHSMIQQDTSNETCMARVQRRVQKLANAGQKAIAYCALLEHEKQLLKKTNSEAKCEDRPSQPCLERARGRVELEPEPEPEVELEPEPEPEIVRDAKKVRKSIKRRTLKRTSITEAGLPEPTPEAEPVKLTRDIPPITWSAPVARMY